MSTFPRLLAFGESWSAFGESLSGGICHSPCLPVLEFFNNGAAASQELRGLFVPQRRETRAGHVFMLVVCTDLLYWLWKVDGCSCGDS